MIRSFDQAAAGLAVSGVLDALRIAASWLRDDPPDPPYRAVLRTSITAPRHPLHTADRSQPRRALRDDRNALTVAELAEVAEVEVDNRLDRHRFTVPDLAD